MKLIGNDLENQAVEISRAIQKFPESKQPGLKTIYSILVSPLCYKALSPRIEAGIRKSPSRMLSIGSPVSTC